MRHARIPPEFYQGSHAAQNRLGFLHALERDVRIWIAGAEKYRGSCERALIISGHCVGANQAACQGHDRAVSARMAGDEFAGHTSALRKAEDGDPLACHAPREQVGDDGLDFCERGIQVRLVGLERG